MGVDAIGRRDEIERIANVLTGVAAGGRGHVVELGGVAGVGKSTVFAAVLERAEATGWQVFQAAPTAAESAFPWTGLAQVAQGVRRDLLDPEARPYVANVDAAISGARRGPVEPELVAFGLAGLLDSFREPDPPVLLAVDDYHWLDAASAGAIAFALRGAASRRCVVLLAHRTGERRPFEPERVVPAAHFTRIEIAGLSLASLREIIATATGVTFGRAELAQLHQRTGGNPLYAVELARMVVDGVPLDAAALPESLRATLGQRVAALPLETRQVLGAAALTVHPTTDLLGRALPGLDIVAALAPAEAAAVAQLRHTRGAPSAVGFRHPLLAAAALDSLTTEDRRSLHAALAAAVDDPVERAGHLAVDLRPDATLAALLEAAAREASARGAVDAAVDIAQSAIAASPVDGDRLAALERCHLHAELALHAGRLAGLPAQVATLQRELGALVAPEGQSRARRDLTERTALLEALVVTASDGSGPGAVVAERALATVAEPHRRVRLQMLLVRTIQHHDVARAAVLADELFGAGSEHAGWDALLGASLLAMARVAAGDPIDLDALLARAETERLTDDQRDYLFTTLTEVHVWTDHPRAEEVCKLAIDRMERIGNRSVHLSEQMYLSQHLFVRGQFRRADELMTQIQEYSGEFLDSRQSGADLALLRAAQGHTEAALQLIDTTLGNGATVEPTEDLWVACAAGSVAHTLGRPDAADTLLAAESMAIGLGIHAVRGLHIRRDLVEALVAANRLDEAHAALARLHVDAERNQVPTARADAEASAGVVAAATGEFDSAREHFARAAAVQRQFDLRYELARTLLAAGSAARRAGSRSDARGHLEDAQTQFDTMGAAAWSQRCAQELERIPGRRRAAASTDLTPTERQIAELVAAGRTNAEIAAALFVTVSTVESNLTRTYRKLRIRSRTELARHINGAS